MDVSENLPGLIARPGLTAWRPTVDRSAEVTYESFDDFLKASVDPALKLKLSQSHWPPKNTAELNLHRW